MSAVGQQGMPVRTGYELIEAHRAGAEFVYIPDQDGTIKEVTDKAINVVYKDGSTFSYALGRSYGGAGGKVFPRMLVTDRRKGYKFTSGEVIAWDESYFYRDWIETKQVSIYTGVPAVVALLETPDTYEDGSSLSSKFASRVGSNITHTREMLVNYDEYIEMIVKVGDHVASEDALARILPAGVDGSNIDESSID